MIEIRGLTKTFGHQHALRNIDLDIGTGEIVALLGPNGAGKTTLLRVLATLLKPSTGSIRINGMNLTDAGPEVRRHIGFLSHQSLLYGDLTVEENLRFFGRLYGVESLEVRVDQLLNTLVLADRRHDLVRFLSRGMVQRASLARAILHRPMILLLDEPYTGLDQQAVAILTDTLNNMHRAGHTVVISTHSLDQGLRLSDRIAILARGRLVHSAPSAGLDLTNLTAIYQRLVPTGTPLNGVQP